MVDHRNGKKANTNNALEGAAVIQRLICDFISIRLNNIATDITKCTHKF